MALCKHCMFARSKTAIGVIEVDGKIETLYQYGERTDACDRIFLGPKAHCLMDGNRCIGCIGGIEKGYSD